MHVFAMFRPLASSNDAWSTAGSIAASSWLSARGLPAVGRLRWHAEISLDVVDGPAPAEFDDKVATRFHIDLYSEEWGFFFCHAGKASWIRVTDVPFVHGRDDYQLIKSAPALEHVGDLIRRLEAEHTIQFRRDQARISTNLSSAETTIRAWVRAL